MMAHIKMVETKLTGLQLLVHLIDLEENFFLLFPQPIELLRVIQYLHYFRRRHHCRQRRQRLKKLLKPFPFRKKKNCNNNNYDKYCSRIIVYILEILPTEKNRLRICSNALLLSKENIINFFVFSVFVFLIFLERAMKCVYGMTKERKK